MPYRIIKRVKRAAEYNLSRGIDYAANLGVDLDDENTWKLYPLYRGSNRRLRGEVTRLFDASGNEVCSVNENYEFEVYCSQYYGAGLKIIETRFLYLPKDFVQGYGVDEGMAVDLLLREVVRQEWNAATSIPLYEKILRTGPMDIVPKDKNPVSSLRSNVSETEGASSSEKKYDVFICHASEDKESFVRALAEALSKDLKVWYDEFTLSLGDSLRRSIDRGLSDSRFGIVVLSENFFQKDWPQKELDGLVAKEGNFDKVILPIWHGVSREQVQKFSPTLADRVAVRSDKGLDHVVQEILRVVQKK